MRLHSRHRDYHIRIQHLLRDPLSLEHTLVTEVKMHDLRIREIHKFHTLLLSPRVPSLLLCICPELRPYHVSVADHRLAPSLAYHIHHNPGNILGGISRCQFRNASADVHFDKNLVTTLDKTLHPSKGIDRRSHSPLRVIYVAPSIRVTNNRIFRLYDFLPAFHILVRVNIF